MSLSNPNSYIDSCGDVITPNWFEPIESGYYYEDGNRLPCERYRINEFGDCESVWLADIYGYDYPVEVDEGEEFLGVPSFDEVEAE